MLEFRIFELLPSPEGKDKHERFESFFSKSIQLLEIFHYRYLKYTLNQERIDRDNNKEAIKRILLSAALNDSAKSMNQKELAMYINN